MTHKELLFVNQIIPYDSINEVTTVELLPSELFWAHQIQNPHERAERVTSEAR